MNQRDYLVDIVDDVIKEVKRLNDPEEDNIRIILIKLNFVRELVVKGEITSIVAIILYISYTSEFNINRGDLT